MNTTTSRRALITGAGSGIGRAVAELLGREEIELILVGRRRNCLEEVAAACSANVVVVPADVTTSAGRDAIREAVGSQPIDYLVQLAGNMEFGELLTLDRELWERAFATHVHARLYLIQDLLSHLRPGARILHVGSRSGTKVRRGAAAYCCSYAAALMLSECLRQELASRGLLLTSFLPGSVDTPLLHRSMAVSREIFPDGALYAAEQARGELVTPERVAQFVRGLLLEAPAEVYDQPLVSL